LPFNRVIFYNKSVEDFRAVGYRRWAFYESVHISDKPGRILDITRLMAFTQLGNLEKNQFDFIAKIVSIHRGSNSGEYSLY